jgi:hypothetical protein
VIRHDGKLEIGPNAALVWGPYGYLRGDPNRRLSEIDLFARPIMPKLKLFTNMEFMSMVRQSGRVHSQGCDDGRILSSSVG